MLTTLPLQCHESVPALDRVLGICELFEAILESCNAFSILASLGVCRSWREFILHSKSIQQHLRAIQPPTWLPNTSGTNGKDQGNYKLVDEDKTPWCFRTTASHGTLWIVRIPKAGLETFILISHSPKKPMVRLGKDSSTMYLMGDRQSWIYLQWGRTWGEVMDENVSQSCHRLTSGSVSGVHSYPTSSGIATTMAEFSAGQNAKLRS